MLLAVDIGNTNLVVGLYEGTRLKDHFRIASRQNITPDEAGFYVTHWLQSMRVPNEEIDKVIVGSVVPGLTSVLETTSKRYFGCFPIIVSNRIKLPITVEIDQPDQIGADRICNAAAGYAKFGGPIVIVDFGTATTFDVVNKSGAYIGGIITPGPETSMAELARKAARLFEIRIEQPDSVIGKSTAGALKSGLFYGLIGQTDFIIDKILEQDTIESPKVIATGGLASGIEKHSRHISAVEPTLTLEGLRILAELNED
ncbi:MAG: type III pantothenate kinase [bacterium]|nr:type III pantothenate kinase [bacterium]